MIFIIIYIFVLALIFTKALVQIINTVICTKSFLMLYLLLM